MFDKNIYHYALSQTWSKDLCSQFKDYTDYKNCGIGVGILYQNKLVSGASSYTIYNGGIEIDGE